MARVAAPTNTKWAREYETIYILWPDITSDAASNVVDRIRDVIKRHGGTLTKLDNWGKRKLAYPIRKNSRGIFVYLKYVGFGDLVAELERNLRLLDHVVRFQTVLLARGIDLASVVVQPEDVEYLHVEEEAEEEDAELERVRSLGMAPRAPSVDEVLDASEGPQNALDEPFGVEGEEGTRPEEDSSKGELFEPGPATTLDDEDDGPRRTSAVAPVEDADGEPSKPAVEVASEPDEQEEE